MSVDRNRVKALVRAELERRLHSVHPPSVGLAPALLEIGSSCDDPDTLRLVLAALGTVGDGSTNVRKFLSDMTLDSRPNARFGAFEALAFLTVLNPQDVELRRCMVARSLTLLEDADSEVRRRTASAFAATR